MQKREKEAEAKDAIIHAATSLFKKYGIHKTTMEEISLSMGKSNKYAYYYFKNKEEIFSEFGKRELARMLSEINKLVSKEKSLEGKIKVLFHARFHCIHDTIASYPMTASEIGINMPAITGMIKALSLSFVADLESLLKKGVASGKFRNIKTADCQIMAETYSEMMASIDVRFAVMGSTIPYARFDILVESLMRGLG